mgnify:CR=1 FL=1
MEQGRQKAAGMEDEGVTIHSLRHTYASFAIAPGRGREDPADAARPLLSQHHIEHLTALWPERLDDVANAIGALRERELV